MKRRTLLLRLLRFWLSGMLVLILHEFLAEGTGLGERPALAGFLPLAAAYFPGCVFPGRKRGWLLLPPACAGALFLSAAVTGIPVTLSLHTVFLALDAALFFLLGRNRGEAWPSALGLPAAGFSLLTCGILSWRGRTAAFPGLCAVLVLVFWLLDRHREGMESGLHNAPGEAPMPYPRGHRRKNLLLILLFFGVCLGIAAIPALEKGADRLWSAAVSGTKELAGAVAAGVRERAEAPLAGTPAPTPSPTPTPEPVELPEEEAPQRAGRDLQTVFRAVFILAGVLALVALAYLYRKTGGAGISPRELWRRLKRLFREKGEETPYVDQVEKLRPWRDLTEAPRAQIRARLRRARKRRLRLEELPDDRSRVRHAYGEVAASPSGVPLTPAMTPSEVGAAYHSEPIRELAEQYNLARYAPDAELSPEAGVAAASALRELRILEKRQAARRSRARTGTRDDSGVPAVRGGRETARKPVPEQIGPAGTAEALSAILPAAPVWLPFADVWDNLRCAAGSRAAALQAAELAGLDRELLRSKPRSLTPEQQWLAVMARSLAAGAGEWEADLSLLDPAAAQRVAGALERAAERAGVRITLTGEAPENNTA